MPKHHDGLFDKIPFGKRHWWCLGFLVRIILGFAVAVVVVVVVASAFVIVIVVVNDIAVVGWGQCGGACF